MALSSSAQVPPPPPDSSKSTDVVFSKVEIDAAFPGGDMAWMKYLQKNLNPDIPVENGAPAGLYTVVVKFIVSKDGNVSNIQPENNCGYGIEKEAVRVIQNSGKWQPAIQNGRAVNAYRRQPVTFLVENEDIDIHSYPGGQFRLYTGVDNILTVKVTNVKNKDLKLSISQGTITATEDGQFIARVTTPGRAIITVYSTKKDKELGKVSFEVWGK